MCVWKSPAFVKKVGLFKEILIKSIKI